MIKRQTRIQLRRKYRSRKKRVSEVTTSANKQLDRHLFRRWQNIIESRRFIVSWLSLGVLLIAVVAVQARSLGQYYLVSTPVDGGVYTEGIVGQFTNANPLFAANNADAAVSKLVFSSLLTYGPNNDLRPDLAEKWTVDDRNIVYTVVLRNGVVWHDGQPVTADDVVFTYQLIQNPDVKSPLLTGWTGIKIEKIDNRTIRFILPSPFSPFPHALTSGIVPKHILVNVPVSQLRSAPFNTNDPVGSGPFKWRSVSVFEQDENGERQSIELVRNDRYYMGKPGLDGINLQTFPDQDALSTAFANKEVVAAAGLDNFRSDAELFEKNVPLTSSMMLFLRTDQDILKDVKVRQALVRATNTAGVISKLGYPVIPVKEPLLRDQAGYDPAYQQAAYNPTDASKLLSEAGWVVLPGKDERHKGTAPLSLKLVAESTPENSALTGEIQRQWAAVGVKLDIDLKDSDDFIQSHVLAHNYDVLLYPINIGADPDVYAYWHSSQAEPGKFNFSNFKNRISDIALEGGRTRTEPELRAAKYRPFLEAWRNEAPAIGLYQPRFLYIANQPIYNFKSYALNTPADRFNAVYNWRIETQKQASATN